MHRLARKLLKISLQCKDKVVSYYHKNKESLPKAIASRISRDRMAENLLKDDMSVEEVFEDEISFLKAV